MLRETEPLLRRNTRTAKRVRRRLGFAALFLCVLLLTAHTLAPQHFPWPRPRLPGRRHPHKRNMIFFVTDGMGPASLSLTRSFRQLTQNLPHNDTLWLDRHLVGSSRTRSSDSLITDSAAGATAFSCARKSYNGAIGVVPVDGSSGGSGSSGKAACGTVLEAAHLAGYRTGLVVTTRITDATPGAFSAHADYRVQEDLIAEQQLGGYAPEVGRAVDLMVGGGSLHFRPHGRGDKRDLLEEARHSGWQVVDDMRGFESLQAATCRGRCWRCWLRGTFPSTSTGTPLSTRRWSRRR